MVRLTGRAGKFSEQLTTYNHHLGGIMSEFTNVTVVKKANIYFDGKVVSRTVLFADGSKKTLGIMQPGEYEFSTGLAEIMEIISGDLEWQMKGEAAWHKVTGGEAFNVPANSTFVMRVTTVTDYCCSFVV
jgi:uncharacterized protein YaiE (UPF0345 family)